MRLQAKSATTPNMLYTDAEAGLTGAKTHKWLRQKKVAYNVTLKHGPVAERMIGYIKKHMFNAMCGTSNPWWDVVDNVVSDYNEKHVTCSAQMTPTMAAQVENRAKVETQIEHQQDGRPATTGRPGNHFKVVIKKKLEKGYVPDWTDEVYTVRDKVCRNDTPLNYLVHALALDCQAKYVLEDPINKLPSANAGMYQRGQVLLVQPAH